MVEAINTEVKPEVQPNAEANPEAKPTEQPAEAVQPNKEEQKPDLVSRVSQVKPEETKPTDTADFNVNDIENIKDPEAKAYAEKAYKSFEKGYQQKYQEIAELRKKYETEDTSNWTPEKIRSLTQDPKFVSAAQEVMSAQNAGLTEDEYSALTDTEKAQFKNMQQQINNMTQQNQALVTQQQDEGLKSKYSNYDSEAVNTAVSGLIAGKVVNTREWIHRALDYEDGIKRAYQLGLEDRKLDMGEKTNSISVEGNTNIQPSGEPLKREEGESPVEFFKRLGQKRLAESKTK